MQIWILTSCLCALAFNVLAQDWKLVWSDEFEGSGKPDPAKWDYERGFVRNREAQLYTDREENARREDGLLLIEARRERVKNPRYSPEDVSTGKKRRGGPEYGDYTSASLITKGKADWLYGRVEVRAKLPSGRGTWPAIWMLGTNMTQVGWPACGEIDIMEFVGYAPGRIHANIHTTKYNHVKGTGKGDQLNVPDATETFHVYALEWHPDRLDFFVDNTHYFTFRKESSDVEVWPFDKPHYLILNLAIGGDWGARKGIDDSIFPARYWIDYVRVYQNSTAAAK